MSLVGIRVLRGPDWSGEDVDGGDGHLGTVVNVGGLETVDVLWDNGKHSTCRVGESGKYDLRIFDNGTIGIRHTQFVCSSCSEREIFGMRWQCNQCKDVNLCPVCYVSDKHDIHHEFIRYETPESKGTSVSKRGSAVKCQAMGIFPGATVKRGQDWNWGNQDGGDGEHGEVISIENNTGSSSARNIVRVSWKSNGRTDIYRLGGIDGKMDLQFVEQSRGFHYYRDHLPVCKKETKSKIVKSNTTLQTNSEVLEDGDKVCIMVSSDNLKELQKHHSAFTTGMLDCIGKTGEVKGFTQNGDAMVEFDKLRFRFYPGALKKIHDIDVEDMVRILPDENKVTILQENHGGYFAQMKAYLGKVGQVEKKDSDGDVVVKFGRRIFMYNPACCTPAPGESVFNDTDDDDASDEDSSNGLDMPDLNQALLLLMGSLFTNRAVGQVDDTMSVLCLYKAISDGDTATTRDLIRRQPTLVNITFKGVNPLILSSHREIVSELLAKGADINKTDHLGNTPLIAAIIGKEEAIAKFADVKPANNNRRTALHCAAVVDYGDLITRLIQKGCDCNYQDSEGDTALHDAILTGSDKAVVALCCAPALDVTVMNKTGFNTIQFAALKNRKIAKEKVIERNKSIVHEKTSDWFTPLHIAAVNDHTDIASILLSKKMVIECQNVDANIENVEQNIMVTEREATLIEQTWREKLCTLMYFILVESLGKKLNFVLLEIPRYDSYVVNSNLKSLFSFFHPSTYLIECVTIECQEEAEILQNQNNVINQQEANIKFYRNLSDGDRGMTSHCKRGNESRWYIIFMLFVLIQVSCGYVISPEDYEMKWNLPIKAARTSFAKFLNNMNITIGTYHNNEVKETMLYKDRLKVEVNTTDDGKEQIKLRILNPTASDLIADYTADVYLNTGKLLAGIKPDFDVQLEPYTSYVIASEGNVAKLVWILQDNRLPTRITISRENKLYHTKQFVAEWTEGNCLNQQQCDVDLTSTPDVGGINQMVTLSIPSITLTYFDFVFYCQVFTTGGMSMKSDIQLVHEGYTSPPGEFATSKCSTSKTIKCEKCQPDTFNMNRDESSSCEDCMPTCGSQSRVLHYCNSTSDLKCECNHGFRIRPGKLDTACFPVEDTTNTADVPMVTEHTTIFTEDESLRNHIATIVIVIAGTMLVFVLLF